MDKLFGDAFVDDLNKQAVKSFKNSIKGFFRKVAGLDVSKELLIATLHGDVDTIKSLLTATKVNIDVRGEYDRTPLIITCVNGRPDLALEFINQGADVNAKDAFGNSPLIWAARNGLADCSIIIQTLIKNGADFSAKNNEGKDALTVAEEAGNLENVKIIKQGLQQAEKFSEPKKTSTSLK
jgi:ankyrin repeat protein